MIAVQAVSLEALDVFILEGLIALMEKAWSGMLLAAASADAFESQLYACCRSQHKCKAHRECIGSLQPLPSGTFELIFSQPLVTLQVHPIVWDCRY